MPSYLEYLADDRYRRELTENVPDVSIIIPTYNRATLLPRAIKSALKQTHKNIEIIIADDSSTDNTSHVIEAYQKLYIDRIRYFSVPHLGSPARALNEGILRARGSWICWLSDDDEWSPDRVEKHLKYVKTFPDFQATYCAQWCDHGGDSHQMSWDRMKNEGAEGNILPWLRHTNFVSTLIARSTLWRALLVSEDPRLRGVEDWHLWLRMAQMVKIGYSDGYVLVHILSDSISKRMTPAQVCTATAAMYQDLGMKRLARKMRSPVRRLWRWLTNPQYRI